MNRLQKLLAGMLCLCVCAGFLSACGKEKVEISVEPVNSVYATFYPLYAAAQLLTDGVPNTNLHCLVQPQDGCLRDYQLSDWDLALLSTSNLIIAGGRELESFESVLYALGEDGPAVSPVLYDMELAEYKGINTQDDTDSHWLDANPHIYMQISGMTEIAQRIASSLILVDPENEELYLANLKRAEERLQALSDELDGELAGLKGQKVIVMNEALVYAAQGFGLEIDLCYERESGEDLFDSDLQACLKMLEQSDAQVVLIEKQAPRSLSEALENAGYRIAAMDVMSTRRANEGSDGYFVAQRANARALVSAFIEENSSSDAAKTGE